MAPPLGVGVVGLGRQWRQQYRPALLALAPLFEIRALYDQTHRRAVGEARRLNAEAVGGVTALLEHPGVEAVLLPDRQWFGLWPVEAACRGGQAVLWGGWAGAGGGGGGPGGGAGGGEGPAGAGRACPRGAPA